jgi:iron(III) transport system substrate-binding protein
MRLHPLRMRAGQVIAAIAAAMIYGLASPTAFAQVRTKLQVYSTLEPANIAEFKRAFEQDNPDIEIVWIRDSTGVITARIVSEGDRQRGDAIWGLAVTSVAKFKTLGLLEAYGRPT